MKVKDVMTRKVLSVEPTASVLQAVRLMLLNKISGLPVVDAAGTLVGVVTEGDFLRRTETATELCFGAGPRRRSAPQVSDLIDSDGVTRSRLFTNRA